MPRAVTRRAAPSLRPRRLQGVCHSARSAPSPGCAVHAHAVVAIAWRSGYTVSDPSLLLQRSVSA
jgi:hypothetical protein